MDTASCDMHEELFVEMISPQEPVPLEKDRVAEEWRYYKMSPEISSKYGAVVHLMGLYVEACFYDRAIIVCKEAMGNLLLKDYWAGLYFHMGQVCEHKKDFDMAFDSYFKSLDIGSGNPYFQYWQHNNLAFCYLIKKDFAAAERHCQIAIDIDDANWKPRYDSWDRNWNAWKNMGVAMEHTGRYLEAASFYTTGIKLSRGNERAVLHLRRLLERHPGLAQAWKEAVEDLFTYYNVIV